MFLNKIYRNILNKQVNKHTSPSGVSIYTTQKYLCIEKQAIYLSQFAIYNKF